MHIDFFFPQQKTETGRDEGFFFFSGGGGGRRRGVVSCACKQYIFLYKKKKARVGWQQFWEVSITPSYNKALIWALDNVSAPCLCSTLNLAHLAFLCIALLRDTPLVTFLSLPVPVEAFLLCELFISPSSCLERP